MSLVFFYVKIQMRTVPWLTTIHQPPGTCLVLFLFYSTNILIVLLKQQQNSEQIGYNIILIRIFSSKEELMAPVHKAY